MAEALVVNRAEATCCTRREQLHGREHLVVPVVALVPGVLNGELVPADEVALSVQAWNDVPIPLDHPRARGIPISARQPEVLEQAVVGRLYGANVDPNGKLRGEMWLDVARLNALGQDGLRELLEAGGPVEVSTAYFRDLDVTTPGTGYTGVARRLRPDHLALLPAGKGACSWADGCGAPRVNAEAAPVGAPVDAARAAARSLLGESGGRAVENEIVTPNGDAEAQAPAVNAQPILPEPTPVPAPVPAPVANEVTEFVALVKEWGGVAAMRDALASIKANADNERGALLAELTANARQTFSAEELGAMPTATLRKFADALRPADYAGRGGPRVNEANDGWQVLKAPEVK